MIRNHFKIFAVLHIVFIVCICSISAYSNYCEFHKLEKKSILIKQLSKLLVPKVVQLYGRISGCDSGYGFFAPNVRSSGIVVMNNDNKNYTPEFKSQEARIRFSTFSDQISQRLIDGKKESKHPNDSLDDAYQNLLFEAIAVKLINREKLILQNPVITYNLYDVPSLQHFRNGKTKTEMLELYRLRLELNNKNN